jgi:hypothetical protein
VPATWHPPPCSFPDPDGDAIDPDLIGAIELSTLDDEIAMILAQGLSESAAPAAIARRLRENIPDERLAVFSEADPAELEHALTEAAVDFPVLVSTAGVRLAGHVQAALAHAQPLQVAWLVRLSGPGGCRGQLSRLPSGPCTVGSASTCQLQLVDDGQLAEVHAELRPRAGGLELVPLAGEGTSRILTDGEEVRFGRHRFVLKWVDAAAA